MHKITIGTQTKFDHKGHTFDKKNIKLLNIGHSNMHMLKKNIMIKIKKKRSPNNNSVINQILQLTE